MERIPDSILKSSFKNYTGVFERYYIAHSVHLLQRLLNKEKLQILILLEDSETSVSVNKYAESELKKLNGIQWETLLTNDFSQWKEKIKNKKSKFDAFLPLQHFSLRNKDGSYVAAPAVVQWISENSSRPSVYAGGWQVSCGGTMSISIRPKEQGVHAAQLTLQVLQKKTPSPLIPPSGDIDINYQSTEKMKIKIPFDILSNANILKTTQIPCNPK